MKDTSKEIMRIQREIFLKKPLGERMRIACKLIDDGRKIIECRIKSENPTISEAELNVEIFRQRYSHILSPEMIEDVVISMRNYFLKK